MKDFIKWLGVNEKIAKVAVWMLIFMVFLTITNTMLESIGFPHYQITYDNLIKININKLSSIIFNALITILNFYTIVLLVFRVKETKNIFKYCALYYVLNVIINQLFGYAVLQIFIIGYCVLFCYFYSKKNWKYIIFAIASILFNIFIQGIWYTVKAKFIEFPSLNGGTIAILSLDYFIIMAIIILVKEIYLKKRGVKNG